MPIDPITMMAVSQGVSMLTGKLLQGRAQRRQRKALRRQAAEMKALYEKDANMDFFDTEQARSAIKTLRDRVDRDNKIAENTAVVTGATPEAVNAAKARTQSMYADSINKLAGYATQFKDNAKSRYMNVKMGYDNALNNSKQQMADSWGNFASNAMNGLSSSLMGMGGGAKAGANPTNPASPVDPGDYGTHFKGI